MAGEGGFDADVSRFFIAHLTDHDDIGVGPQEGSHGGGKCKADPGLNLYLPQAVLGNFHRIFRRPDFPVGGIDKS